MNDYVLKLQEDLRKKLDRLCLMHNGPALYVADHFAELRSQFDYDAERLLGEIHLVKRLHGKARKQTDVNRTRIGFIRILEELEKRTSFHAKPQTASSEVYASFEQRVGAFKDSSSSLDDLEDSYVQLALEIIKETNQVEKRILGEQTMLFWPSKHPDRLGSLVYFGDYYLSRQQIDWLFTYQHFSSDRHRYQPCVGSLLVPTRESFEDIKSKKVMNRLSVIELKRFGVETKFWEIAKNKQGYSGCLVKGTNVDRELIVYEIQGASYATLHYGKSDRLDETRVHNLGYAFETICKLEYHRIKSLQINFLPAPLVRLSQLTLTGVHFDESFDTNLLATCTSLAHLKLQATFSKQVKFELAFLGALRKLERLELTLRDSPSDLSVFKQLSSLSYLQLEDSSFFYAEKLLRLTKVVLKQILSAPLLQTLELSCFDIEAIDQDMFSSHSRLRTLHLARNRISSDTGVYGPRQMRFYKMIHSDIRALSTASFAEMTRLKELSLTGNSIADLPHGVFEDFCVLERLELDKNLIKRINNSVFGKLVKLKTLKLDGNPIESIEANAFAQLVNLNTLSLVGCKLKSIDSEMFAGLVKFGELNLKNNLIERIEVVTDNGRRINGAGLSCFDMVLIRKHLFANLSSLHGLNLSGNKLEKLGLFCFCNLVKLTELDLSSNKINKLNVRVESELLPSLQTLDLNDNQLTTIVARALPLTLTELRLSRNGLKSLDDGFFAQFTRLKRLSLDQNELTMNVTELTFAWCRQSLLEINLTRNQSICVTEGAVRRMTRVRSIKWDICEYFTSQALRRSMTVRRLSPEVIRALREFSRDQSAKAFNNLLVFKISDCSIKGLTNATESTSDIEMPESGLFNLNWLPKVAQLIALNLSRNLIETLDDPMLFANFESIIKIDLSGNQLSRIHRNIFKCLPHLETIDLSGNKLTSIDTGLFRHLRYLKDLNLSSNGIAFLNLARLFRTCPRLKSLEIADNQLDERSTAEPIEARTSSDLEKLVLKNNCLEKMDFVGDMTSLKLLDLRGNRIESVMSKRGENVLRELSHLDLSSNRIDPLTDEMFVHLRAQLEHFDISENRVASHKLEIITKKLI